MQKVVFSVSKVNHRDEKSKGVGYVADGNLMPCLSRNGKAYIKVFDIRKCRPTDDTATTFMGNITVAYTDVPIPREISHIIFDLQFFLNQSINFV